MLNHKTNKTKKIDNKNLSETTKAYTHKQKHTGHTCTNTVCMQIVRPYQTQKIHTVDHGRKYIIVLCIVLLFFFEFCFGHHPYQQDRPNVFISPEYNTSWIFMCVPM